MKESLPYSKLVWRQKNVDFISSEINNFSEQNYSYIETIGDHTSTDKKNDTEMYALMCKSGLVTRPEQFVGVDNNPLCLIKRKKEKKNYQPYPLVFGDLMEVALKIQKSNGNLINIDKKSTPVSSKIVALNYDSVKAIRESGSSELWTMYGPCISEFLNRALEKYASRVCVIINHVRDRGTNIPGISNRKKRLYENIALYLTNRKSRTIIPEDKAVATFEEYTSNNRKERMMTARIVVTTNSVEFRKW